MLLRRRSMMGGAESLAGKLGALEVGTRVTVGSVGEFMVVHQGNPDNSIYTDACNGTWLLRENSYTERSWSARNNYADSNIAAWLAGTFMNLFSDTIKANILTVKIPYYYNSVLYTLDNAFECQAFLPAAVELGLLPENNSTVPADGKTLEYFVGTNPNIGTSGADEKRATSDSTRYWTRSALTTDLDSIFSISPSGAGAYRDGSYSYGVRPVIIMNKYTAIDNSEIIVWE